MNGQGQPLDVGRLTRVIPDGLRRAVVARGRGCARCGRPPSWCEAHHLVAWEHGGRTAIDNLVLLCRACHRLIHHASWGVTLIDGIPEFYPPTWIDPQRRPRRRPPPQPTAAQMIDSVELVFSPADQAQIAESGSSPAAAARRGAMINVRRLIKAES